MTAEQSLPHALLFFHRLANTFLEALPGDFPFVSAAKVNKENAILLLLSASSIEEMKAKRRLSMSVAG
jgi:hypothetical protein